MWKLPVLKSPQKGANRQKRISREISATCKSRNARRFFLFYQFVLPSAVKSKNKPDRAATAADREVAVIRAAPFNPDPPKIPVPAHATRFPFLTNGKLE
jgi:hypothetical protein